MTGPSASPDPATFRRGVRLGVDVGSVRVGLAVSDPDGLVASGVRTVPRDVKGSGDLRELAAEVAQRGAVEVVVGLPLSLDGTEGRAAALARGYAEALARAVAPVPVRLVDERLSTVSAQQALRGAGVRGRRQRQVLDRVAAAVVLQAALDGERAAGRATGMLVELDQVDGSAAQGSAAQGSAAQGSAADSPRP